MKTRSFYYSLIFLSANLSFCFPARSHISPFQYGLKEAKSDIERYKILYETHKAALEAGTYVTYKGIDSLVIEIPQDGKPIPLGDNTDFNGMVLTVVNNAKNAFVFELLGKTQHAKIIKEQISKGDFCSIPTLRHGLSLLIVTDKNLWVENRKGHNYGHIRKDLIVIKDGRAENDPVSSYDNAASSPLATFCKITTRKKTFSNIEMRRAEHNQKKAYLLDVNHQYNVKIENVKVATPVDTMVDDQIFRLRNSAYITFNKVTIDGTYSRKDHSGYGILMNNVYGAKFVNLKAHGNWGIFGNNNINKAELHNCDINRFDIHCYGRDVYFSKCTLKDKGIPLSSVFGEIVFEHCDFIDCIPVLFRDDYNAYTPFNLIIKSCTFITSLQKLNFLICATGLRRDENVRPELKNKSLPNVYVKGLKVYKKGDAFKYFYLFNFGRQNFKVNSRIVIQDLEFFPQNGIDFKIQNDLTLWDRVIACDLIQHCKNSLICFALCYFVNLCGFAHQVTSFT